DGDLLGLAGLVGRGGVLAAAEGSPGGGGELQAAVVAVAGVDRPVPSRLALGDLVPDSLMSDRGAGPGHREPGGHDGTAGGGGQLRCRVQAADVDGRTVGAVGGLASGDSQRGLRGRGLGSGGACDGPVTCPAPGTTSPCPHISRVTAFLT